jgi:hypothetical protein
MLLVSIEVWNWVAILSPFVMMRSSIDLGLDVAVRKSVCVINVVQC